MTFINSVGAPLFSFFFLSTQIFHYRFFSAPCPTSGLDYLGAPHDFSACTESVFRWKIG